MWLVASTVLADLAAVRDRKPALWRELRRFNAPIQLAVAAAHEVVAHATAPAEAAIISLAPCQAGSPDLHRWVREIEAGGAVKMNPTHTLHAVDNLALSVLSIALANHAWAMSLGGAPGMVWSALELAAERDEREVIVLGGDQVSGAEPSPAAAFAMLFARERTPYVATGRSMQLLGVERRPASMPHAVGGASTPDGAREVRPHAAAGAIAMLGALRAAASGEMTYLVPATDGEGIDDIVVHWEVGA